MALNQSYQLGVLKRYSKCSVLRENVIAKYTPLLLTENRVLSNVPKDRFILLHSIPGFTQVVRTQCAAEVCRPSGDKGKISSPAL